MEVAQIINYNEVTFHLKIYLALIGRRGGGGFLEENGFLHLQTPSLMYLQLLKMLLPWKKHSILCYENIHRMTHYLTGWRRKTKTRSKRSLAIILSNQTIHKANKDLQFWPIFS